MSPEEKRQRIKQIEIELHEKCEVNSHIHRRVRQLKKEIDELESKIIENREENRKLADVKTRFENELGIIK